MTKTIIVLCALAQLTAFSVKAQITQATIENGKLEGVKNPESFVIAYKGIPYAQPPVGELRWKDPQPAKNWEGILKADHFRSNAMQKQIFGDMGFRSSGMSEDCLYLNVWTPAKTPKAKLPVMVYFYGGGFMSGDGSEPRYDGESISKKGIVTITVNYRLGIFGFFVHPELSAESSHHSSGNYGFLDQIAALEWVKRNISKFGGDPNHITIAGESAGSASVSLLTASPLSKHLFNAAIGESGAALKPGVVFPTLTDAEKLGVKTTEKLSLKTLADLRAMPAVDLLNVPFNPMLNMPVLDGYFMPKTLKAVFEAGEQAKVPMLVGWNSAEVPYQFLLRGGPPTPENYKKIISAMYGDKADEALKVFPGNTEDEVIKSATAIACDLFVVYSTWKWADLQLQTGNKPVYRYIFSRIRPVMTVQRENAAAGVVKNDAAKPAPNMPPTIGAPHASEIEYALGTLSGNKVYTWTPDDYKVSETMQAYFANFIKTYDPNGDGLPEWGANRARYPIKYMDINVISELKTENNRAQFLFLDKQYAQ